MQSDVHQRNPADVDGSMMMCVGIVAVLMIVATLAVHMGLPQEIAKVITKVCGCHKCLSFWISLIAMAIVGCPLWLALLLSLLAAYVSNWFALLLILLNKIYNKIWQRINQ